MDQRAHFSKAERLCDKKMIHQLFKQGRSFYVKPIKVFYFLDLNDKGHRPPQVLVSVSKKHFKKAVRRNQIKRKIREAYRLNKFMLHDVLEEGRGKLSIGLVFTGSEVPSSVDIQKKIIRIFKRLKWEIQQ